MRTTFVREKSWYAIRTTFVSLEIFSILPKRPGTSTTDFEERRVPCLTINIVQLPRKRPHVVLS